jgi:thiol-disulfide isomerase/thioredoxin
MIQIAILFLLSFFTSSKENFDVISTDPQRDTLSIPVYSYDELKPLLHLNNDTTYVVNFWATWCVPCVKELPHFMQLDSVYEDEAFKVLFVSLDFKKDYLKKLQPFVREQGLDGQVVILEDNDANYWIDDIDKSWGGSIPATLVYRGEKRSFYERTFHDLNELSDIVKPFLNQ